MSDGSVDASRRAFLRTAVGGTAAAGAAGAAAAQAGNETAGNETAASGNETAGTEAAGNETAGTEAAGNETAGTEAAGGNETSGGGGGGGSTSAQPDYGDFFSTVGNYTGTTQDATGQDQVTVTVGAEGNSGSNAFAPPAIHVDNGATVQWEWTGNGSHNVVSPEDGPLDSGSAVQEAGVNYEYTFDEDGIYEYVCIPHEGLGMKGAVVVGSDFPTVEPPEPGGSGQVQLPDSAKSLGVATSFVMAATLGLSYVFIKYGGDYGDAGE